LNIFSDNFKFAKHYDVRVPTFEKMKLCLASNCNIKSTTRSRCLHCNPL